MHAEAFQCVSVQEFEKRYAVFLRKVEKLLLEAPDAEARRKVCPLFACWQLLLVSRSQAGEARLHVGLANRFPYTWPWTSTGCLLGVILTEKQSDQDRIVPVDLHPGHITLGNGHPLAIPVMIGRAGAMRPALAILRRPGL